MDDDIKKNIANLKPSATLAINEKVKNLLKDGKKVFNFGFGQSPFPIPDKIVEVLKENAHKKDYLPMQGLSELREAISKFENKKKQYEYNSSNIIIGPGTKELMFLLNIIFDGDILLPAPSWVSYKPQAILGRNKFHFVETSREKNWFPSAKAIEKIVSQNSKKNYLLFLNSPNNPCGLICENLEELTEVKVSLAKTFKEFIKFKYLFGITKYPNLHPPAAHHLLKPLLIIV